MPIQRARWFMPKIPILSLCGRYNLLIPVFCSDQKNADRWLLRRNQLYAHWANFHSNEAHIIAKVLAL
jgi:hypothetical protein